MLIKEYLSVRGRTAADIIQTKCSYINFFQLYWKLFKNCFSTDVRSHSKGIYIFYNFKDPKSVSNIFFTDEKKRQILKNPIF